jgi:hypothetical protein
MIINKTSYFAFTAFSLLFSFSVSAQAKESSSPSEEVWQVIKEESGIKLSAKKTACTIFVGKKPLVYFFLKLENTTNTSKKVTYNFGLQYVEGCSGCESGNESTFTVEVPANSSVEGDCSFKTTGLSRLVHNPNLRGGWVIEKPMITDFVIK